jgi:hypothetical protein
MWRALGGAAGAGWAAGRLLFFRRVPKGPPFGIGRGELDALLAPGFECLVDEAVEDSIPVFAGKERWMVWQRRSASEARQKRNGPHSGPRFKVVLLWLRGEPETGRANFCFS